MCLDKDTAELHVKRGVLYGHIDWDVEDHLKECETCSRLVESARKEAVGTLLILKQLAK